MVKLQKFEQKAHDKNHNSKFISKLPTYLATT